MRFSALILSAIFMVGSFQLANARLFRESLPTNPSMMIIQTTSELDSIPYLEIFKKAQSIYAAAMDSASTYDKQFKYYLSSGKKKTVETPKEYAFMQDVIARMRQKGLSKPASEVEKKLKKGKFSDKAIPEIQEYRKECGDLYSEFHRSNRLIQEKRRKDGVVECIKTYYPEVKVEDRYLTFVDTILNTAWRPYLFYKFFEEEDKKAFWTIEKWDEEDMLQDWAWINNKEEKKEWDDHGYIYSSHPQYLVSDDYPDRPIAVFNKKGNLIAIPSVDKNKISVRYDDALNKQCKALAYNDDYYGIKNKSAHTQHYVKVQTGLEDMTPQEKRASDRAATTFANALLGSMKANALYGKNSTKARKANNKSALQILGTLNRAKFYDDEGYKWLDRVESFFSYWSNRPYRIERLSPTSFRYTYIDRKGNGLFEIDLTYTTGEAPFTLNKTYTVNSLDGEVVFTPEELRQFEELNARF